MVFFTSDLHFGHNNIIAYCNRLFSSVGEMDNTLIADWNSVVASGDDIYVLGDFTMKPAQDARRCLSTLNGRKYFIRGNLDKFLDRNGAFGDVF